MPGSEVAANPLGERLANLISGGVRPPTEAFDELPRQYRIAATITPSSSDGPYRLAILDHDAELFRQGRSAVLPERRQAQPEGQSSAAAEQESTSSDAAGGAHTILAFR